MNFSDKDFTFIDYLFTMTDDVGIFQHSVYGIPDPRRGYTTDDNSRALILAVLLFERFGEKKYLKLIYKYLAFVLNSQNENGMFKNFMGYNREFLEKEGSEDCFGRCLWAVCRTISSNSVPVNIKRTCQYIIDISLKSIPNLKYSRSKAYSLIGLSYLKDIHGINENIETLSMDLVNLYYENKDENWHWFEKSMTYGNSFLPLALFKAYRLLKKEVFLEVAIESMDFLESVTFTEDYFKPIGCKGWYKKGGTVAEYDQQAIEACETMFAFLERLKITGDKKYLNNAVKCYKWYTGENSKGLSLIDTETGACYDGLTSEGLNYNQGSESIVSYGITFMEISKRVKLITKGGHWLIKDLY